MKKYGFLLLCLLSGAFFAHRATAQVPGGGGPQPGGGAGGATTTPIDGGASLLLASGAAYALKRLRQRQRRA